ncbi:MAG: AAA family ATPase [Candidatus Micrarchaeia archaeon]|jgi:cell division control protein 6
MALTNIFRTPRGENKIFRDENALLPDYLPGELPGREHEVKELVYCLQPASENRQPEHALLYGPPGTGKTTCARYVLKQLSEYSARPLPIYINCWESPSRFSILSAIATELGEMLPRRGIAADEILARVFEIAKKDERIPIVVLDEADRLEASDDGVQILYDLCRAGEIHSLKTAVIAITNDEEFHTRLDARVRSSFVQHAYKFAAYSVPQLKEILQQRASKAFFEGALDVEVVPLCAAVAVKRGGDCRIAFALLRAAGKAAERENAARVEVKHVRATQDEALAASGSKVERKLPTLDELDQKIVEKVRAAGDAGMESGKLYAALSRVSGDRALRQRVDRLEKIGILAVEAVQSGQGRSRLIRMKS